MGIIRTDDSNPRKPTIWRSRDLLLRASLCLSVFLFGLLLLLWSAKRAEQSVIPEWASPVCQLGLTLCITALVYFIFEQVFERANHEQVERVVKEAVGTIDERIEKVDRSLDKLFTHNSILQGAIDNDLICIYANRSDGLTDMLMDIKHSKRVKLIGISLREYFMTAGHHNADMDAVLDEVVRTDGRVFSALIINPYGDQATIRAERESDSPFDASNSYEQSVFYTDVIQSMHYLYKHMKPGKIEGRVYNAAPCCFLVITDPNTYVEQYHYGLPKSGLKGGHFPLLKFPTESTVARHLEGHFDYIWGAHSTVLSDLLEKHMIGVSKSAWECRLMNVFSVRSKCEERIACLLKNATGEIRLLGISLRDFFHGGRRYYRILEQIVSGRRQDGEAPPLVKALFLDPMSEQGRIRSEREEPGIFPGNLHNEVITSLNSVDRFVHSGARVNAKLYRGAPNCFLILTDESVIVEQYHYGSDEPGATILGGKVPVMEYARDSAIYVEMSGHFEFLWGERGTLDVDAWRDQRKGGQPAQS